MGVGGRGKKKRKGGKGRKKRRERGGWALPAGLNVLRLLPPLVIPEGELELAVGTIGEVLGDG